MKHENHTHLFHTPTRPLYPHSLTLLLLPQAKLSFASTASSEGPTVCQVQVSC